VTQFGRDLVGVQEKDRFVKNVSHPPPPKKEKEKEFDCLMRL
jgi:hypothetical protein